MKKIVGCFIICLFFFSSGFTSSQAMSISDFFETHMNGVQNDILDEITITRDDWGIAHIIAETDDHAFYGAGYATAQDRLYQMHRNRRAVQGRLAELEGDRSVHSDAQINAMIDQDIYMRHIGLYKHATKVARSIDETTKLALEAYSAGVNQYISEHGDSLPDLFHGEIPEAWTIVDCIAAWDRLGDYFSGFPSGEAKQLHDFEDLVEEIGYENAIQEMTKEKIIDDSAATAKYEDFDKETIQAIFDYAYNHSISPLSVATSFYDLPEFPKMSHAWVVSGERTDTGAAILHSDPQTKVSIPSIWYEIHIKGATFDARGIGVAGCPGFLIGWNQDVAWGATALGADQADIFRLNMIDENTYTYDDITYTFNTSNEVIKVKSGRDVSIQVKETILGPVVTELLTDVYPGEEYVLVALPQWDHHHHSVEALLEMMKSDDVYSFHDAIQKYQNPSLHSIYGDSNGNIGYSVMAGIPLRSPDSPLAGSVAQDGSSSTFAWVELIPYEVLPHVFNPSDGVLFTANHLSVGNWYPMPLHVGQGGTGDGGRSWRLRERLVENSPSVFSSEDVLDVHYDDVDPERREIVNIGLYLKEIQGVQLSRSADDALTVLKPWVEEGAHCDVSEPYYAAAHHLDLYFREDAWEDLTTIYGSGDGGLCHFLKTMKKRLETQSQAVINETEIAFFDTSLAEGYEKAVSYYGSDPDEWMQHFKQGPGTYTIPYFNTLENFGSLNRIWDTTYSIEKVNGNCIGGQMGQSYSQLVNLADVDSSLALLPVGISEDPLSSHFTDQAYYWLHLMMRPAPLSKTKITGESSTIEIPHGQIHYDDNRADTTPPYVHITRPTNAVYISDIEKIPFIFPLIFGSIQIWPNAYDNESGLNRLELYIDDELKETFSSVPKSWMWSETTCGRHTITLTAYDNVANNASDEITVWKFF